MNRPRLVSLTCGLALTFLLIPAAPTFAIPQPSWKVMKPSNTGIPGEEVRIVRMAPDRKLWVAARWPFWGEGGLGILDRATDVWTVFSNWETALPSPFINDIEFQPNGVAWIATDGGLVRFDGQNFTVWNTANSPLRFNTVRNLSLAPNGHIWVNNTDFNASGDAIYDFDGGSVWRRFAVPQQLPWASPWTDLADVCVDHLGHVWVANDTLNGLAEYDGTTWRLRGGDVDRFDALTEDLAGNIWMKGGLGGYNAFYKYNRTSFTSFPISTTPVSIAVDDDGAVLTGDWLGTLRKTTDGGQTWSFLLTGLNTLYNIEPDPDNADLWIGTPGAVGHFKGDGEWLHDYNTYNTGIPWYWIDRFSLDTAGFFWLATGEAGLSRFDGLRWRNWGAHNAGSEPYPFVGNEPMGGAYRARNGEYWFGGNGIARWNAQTGQFTGFWNWQNNPGMGVTLFISFAEDDAGNLFAETEHGGVMRFQDGLWISEPGVAGVYNAAPFRTDAQGDIWLASQMNFKKWNGQAWTTVGAEWFNVVQAVPSAFDFAPDGSLWIATYGGLVRVVNGVATTYTTANSPLPLNHLTGLDVREDGLVGLCVEDSYLSQPIRTSICLIDGDPAVPANWSTYTYGSAPIPHYDVGPAAFDREGRLWVSCSSEGATTLFVPLTIIPGDLNGDGVVDAADRSLFVRILLDVNTNPTQMLRADLNHDGVANGADAQLFVSALIGP